MLTSSSHLGAADALMSGQDLYNNFNVGGLPFTYPPFAGAVFIPFDLFLQPPPLLSGLRCQLRHSSALPGLPPCGCQPSLAKNSPRRRGNLRCSSSPSAFSETVIKNIELGQVNLVLVLLIMFDTVTKAHYRGFLTGMAAGFKIVPAIFIVFMLVNRRWGDFGRALLGFPDHAGNRKLLRDRSGVAVLQRRTLGYDAGRCGRPLVECFDVWRAHALDPRLRSGCPVAVLAATVAAAGLAIAGFWWNHSRLVAAVVVGITGLLVSPVSWVHHWVWFIPAACAAIALAIRAFRSSDRLVGVCLSIAAAAMVLPELGELRYAGGRLAQDSTLGGVSRRQRLQPVRSHRTGCLCTSASVATARC